MKLLKLRNRVLGFTMVEITVVIVILGALATLTYSVIVPRYRERSYYTRSLAELNAMGNAFNLYVAKNNDYPPDESRNIPAGIKEFVQGQQEVDDWPDAPYPGSVYDYDNWPPDGNGPEHTFQISIRMCSPGQDSVCKANAKKYLEGYVSDSVLNNWDSYSSAYYCIKGSCRAHQSKPMNHPAYCVNCSSKSQIY